MVFSVSINVVLGAGGWDQAVLQLLVLLGQLALCGLIVFSGNPAVCRSSVINLVLC